MNDIGYKDDTWTFNAKCPKCGRLHIQKKLVMSEMVPITIDDLYCYQCKYG